MNENDYKPYTAKRWTEIPKPIVIECDNIPLSEEEKRENDREAEEMLREYGLIKAGEHIRDSKVVKEEESDNQGA